MQSFGDRLQERVRDLGPLCVGVDPSRLQLTAWGRDDDATGVEFAALAVLEAVVGVAAAIKPQVAFFERMGAAGYQVLERLIADAQSAGVMVIIDAKRGDFAPTNEGYAQAWLDPASPLAVDAVTINPYLGFEALAPFLTRTRGTGRGVFVVVASSNDEGRAVQTARTASGERVEDFLLRSIADLNVNEQGLGSIGAVIGATRSPPEFDVAQLHGPFLVPGVGAQGATPDDVGQLFQRCPAGSVVANVARGVGVGSCIT